MTRSIDADTLKRKLQKIGIDAWKKKITASVETILNEVIDIVDALPTVNTVQQWIPCSKEMPDEYEPVLTYTNRGDIRIMEYGMEWNGFMWKDEADYLHDIDFVQAWMPLPERYVVEE